MMMLPLAKISFLWTLFAALWALLALALILIVLIQKGRGGGISAAFGGGAANSLLGTKTGDFLTWVTICLVSLFLIGAVVMGKYMRPGDASGLIPVTTPAAQTQQTTPEQPALPANADDQAEQAAETVETATESDAVPVEQK